MQEAVIVSQQNVPDWLAWVVPVIAAGGAVTALLRRYFSIETRHRENLQAIANVRELVEQGSQDRTEMRKDISRIAEDVAFLRGRIEQ